MKNILKRIRFFLNRKAYQAGYERGTRAVNEFGARHAFRCWSRRSFHSAYYEYGVRDAICDAMRKSGVEVVCSPEVRP